MGKEEKLIIEGRNLLKRDWDSVDFDNTAQARKVPMPDKRKKYDSEGKTIDLLQKEQWNIKDISLMESILNRKSNRKYTEKSLALGELSFLLFATQGVKKEWKKVFIDIYLLRINCI